MCIRDSTWSPVVFKNQLVILLPDPLLLQAFLGNVVMHGVNMHRPVLIQNQDVYKRQDLATCRPLSPVKPLSKIRGRSWALIPQPLSSIRSVT